jgi:hypothetical protein
LRAPAPHDAQPGRIPGVLGLVSRPPKKAAQAEIPFPERGGRRPGSGRKPSGPRAGLRHARRPSFAARFPLHVTLRLRAGLPSLRDRRAHLLFLGGLSEGAERTGFRCIEYSVQTNHVHLVCEASGARALARGVQGLAVRVARRLNRLWGRRGKVFGDRYHVRVLRTPTEVRNALRYVLGNAEHHGVRFPDGVDPCSSARWWSWRDREALFRGASGRGAGPSVSPGSQEWSRSTRSPLPVPRTWLASAGWRRADGAGASRRDAAARAGEPGHDGDRRTRA